MVCSLALSFVCLAGIGRFQLVVRSRRLLVSSRLDAAVMTMSGESSKKYPLTMERVIFATSDGHGQVPALPHPPRASFASVILVSEV